MSKFMQVNETILLLGGTGFIGRNIIDYVLTHEDFSNYKIVVLSRDFQRDIVAPIEYVTGDYADKNVLMSLFSKYKYSFPAQNWVSLL